jgi:hypothetical protein
MNPRLCSTFSRFLGRDSTSLVNKEGVQENERITRITRIVFKIKRLTDNSILHSVKADSLKGVDLRNINLSWANLVGADLTDATMTNATLLGADCSGARLVGASLDGATLIGTILSSANMSGSSIRGTNFVQTVLTGADLTRATTLYTSFTACTSLADATGLDAIQHDGPSTIDNGTLRFCINQLPDLFLEGCGYSREEIGVLRALYAKSPIEFFSAFISHADKKPDSEFAERVYNDLRAANVTCWHFRHDLQMGERWATQIEGAIKIHDKLVVVCSEEGLFREGVVKEIIRAVELESMSGSRKLFPVRLDDFILSQAATDKFNALSTPLRRADWLDRLREYQIGDFTRWKSYDAYKMQFSNLLAALRTY